ncbi:MAG: hypothetical protein KGZ58_09675 [Ignavibacteriales bacterium]|nr:hypothetical protein [Ignavibacteriales bacterium]
MFERYSYLSGQTYGQHLPNFVNSHNTQLALNAANSGPFKDISQSVLFGSSMSANATLQTGAQTVAAINQTTYAVNRTTDAVNNSTAVLSEQMDKVALANISVHYSPPTPLLFLLD